MTELGSPAALLLALLFAGHAAADFVLQTRSMALHKERPTWLGLHIATVLGAHLAALAPLLSPRVAGAAVAIAAAHLAIDVAKTRAGRHLGRHARGPLALFVLDQALHAAVLLVAWLWLAGGPLPPPRWIASVADATWLAWCFTGYAFNANGVGSLIAHFLEPLASGPVSGTPESPPGRGRLIGILERTLVLTLLLVGEWGVIGFVLAAKSIARFEELKRQAFAEYYLIGTLLSVLFAIGTGLALEAIAP